MSNHRDASKPHLSDLAEIPSKGLVWTPSSGMMGTGEGELQIGHRDQKVPFQIKAQFLRELGDAELSGHMPGFAMSDGAFADRDKSEKRPRAHWRETDLRRAIGAAKKAGLRFYSVEVAPDGTISIVVGQQSATAKKFHLRQRPGKSVKH